MDMNRSVHERTAGHNATVISGQFLSAALGTV